MIAPSLKLAIDGCCSSILRRFLYKKSGLDNLPGPVSRHGSQVTSKQLFNPYAWKFHESIAKASLQTVLVKNQDTYEENDGFITFVARAILYINGLLGTLGQHYRKQRKMLNPVFSAAHMRDMSERCVELPKWPSLIGVVIHGRLAGKCAQESLAKWSSGTRGRYFLDGRYCFGDNGPGRVWIHERASDCLENWFCTLSSFYTGTFAFEGCATILVAWPTICTAWDAKFLRARSSHLRRAVLLESFKFSPSAKDSEILWQMSATTSPIVGKDTHPQLPIGISLVK
ncbi:hypothetical protein BT96DRAFT_949150 [Gymnopus androsaceus JB14]|uniref:Uncharacterized protein n=1 Tax=Gymnopus androsaceus JB14 TaxID=1447944 RepID=A0A6A4GMH5_9AGAR|nr:hypothetical protein BT96DRAFT_949150 [Gymnopus androsaceus JB14]